MDRKAQELLSQKENNEIGMEDYIRTNASRLRERIEIYSARSRSSVTGWERFYLNQNGTIDVESKPSGGSEYEKIDESLSIDSFSEKCKFLGLQSAVKKLGIELEKQQPLLPFED